MRRVTALCAIATIAASTLVSGAAVARHMRAPETGYYVIRWDNTGVCTIWNTDLQEKPWHFFSNYEVVSRRPTSLYRRSPEIRSRIRRLVNGTSGLVEVNQLPSS